MCVWGNLTVEEKAKGKKQGVSSVCCIFYFAHKYRKDNLKSNATETGIDWGHRGEEGDGRRGRRGNCGRAVK